MDNFFSSSYIGKKVMGNDGNLLGTCKAVLFDSAFKKIDLLVVFNDDDSFDSDFLYPAKNVISIGDNAIILKKCKPMTLLENSKKHVVNTCTFSLEGNFLGQVQDVILLNNSVSGIILSDNSIIEREKISTVGNDAIFINLNKTMPSCEKRQKKLENELATETKDDKISEKTALNENEFYLIPKTVVANYSLLLNRRVKKDIYNLKDELIIKKDSLVSVSTIELAKFSGKLFDLTINSLTS